MIAETQAISSLGATLYTDAYEGMGMLIKIQSTSVLMFVLLAVFSWVAGDKMINRIWATLYASALFASVITFTLSTLARIWL